MSFVSTLCSLAIGLSSLAARLPLCTRLLVILTFMPFVSAAPQTQPFPQISFKDFSQFIEGVFGPKISLATVLLLLFSMTENPELLSLHARQQHPTGEEKKIVASGWI